MSDLFHPDVPAAFVAKVWAVMKECPHHTFQILTKRPDRMRELAVELPLLVLRSDLNHCSIWDLLEIRFALGPTSALKRSAEGG